MKKLLGYTLVLLIGLGSAYAASTKGHVLKVVTNGCCATVNADKD